MVPQTLLNWKKREKQACAWHPPQTFLVNECKCWKMKFHQFGGDCGAAPPKAISLIMWNCRGLGNLVTKKELGDLTRAKDPSAVFIVETWMDEAWLKKNKTKITV